MPAGFETEEEKRARMQGGQGGQPAPDPAAPMAPLAARQSQGPAPAMQQQQGAFDAALQGRGTNAAMDFVFDPKKAATSLGEVAKATGATATLSAAAPWLAIGYMGARKMRLFNEGTANVQGEYNMQRFNPGNPFGYSRGVGVVGYAQGTDHARLTNAIQQFASSGADPFAQAMSDFSGLDMSYADIAYAMSQNPDRYGANIGGIQVLPRYDIGGDGSPVVSGYTAISEGQAPNGSRLVQTNTYDAGNNLLEYTLDNRTGGDSGTITYFGADGTPNRAEAYDHSEGWKKAVTPIVAMALAAATMGGAAGGLAAGAPLSSATGLAGTAAGQTLASGLTSLGLSAQTAAAAAGAGLLGAGGGATMAALSGAEGMDIIKAGLKGGALAGLSAGIMQASGLKDALANAAGTDTPLGNAVGDGAGNPTYDFSGADAIGGDELAGSWGDSAGHDWAPSDVPAAGYDAPLGGGVDTTATGGTHTTGAIQNITDADFAAADAAQLHQQGIGQQQMQDILTRSGMDPAYAETISTMASNGMSADQMTAALDNRALYDTAPLGEYKPQDLGIEQRNIDSYNQTQAELAAAGRDNSQWQTVGDDKIMVYDDGTGIARNLETGAVYSLNEAQVTDMINKGILNTDASGYGAAIGRTPTTGAYGHGGGDELGGGGQKPTGGTPWEKLKDTVGGAVTTAGKWVAANPLTALTAATVGAPLVSKVIGSGGGGDKYTPSPLAKAWVPGYGPGPGGPGGPGGTWVPGTGGSPGQMPASYKPQVLGDSLGRSMQGYSPLGLAYQPSGPAATQSPVVVAPAPAPAPVWQYPAHQPVVAQPAAQPQVTPQAPLMMAPMAPQVAPVAPAAVVGAAKGGFLNPFAPAREPKKFPMMPNNPGFKPGMTGAYQQRGNPRYESPLGEKKGGVGSRGGLPGPLGIPNPVTRIKKRGGE